MLRWLLLVWLLLAPAWAQSPSPSPEDHQHEHTEHCEHEHHDHDDHDREWTGHGQAHEHNVEVGAGQEYVNPNLHAESDNYPAIYKFMVRESLSEPYLRKGESKIVLRDAAVLWILNILLIIGFYRRRR